MGWSDVRLQDDAEHSAAAGVSRSLAEVLSDVAAERTAQDRRAGLQDLPDGTGRARQAAGAAGQAGRIAAAAGEPSWRHLLAEAFHGALGETEPGRLRSALIRTAAVAVQWVEALDRRNGRLPHRTEEGGLREKLVRDRIPEFIEASGRRPVVRAADPAEFRTLLRAKLYEEAGEYAAAGDPGELADLLEVVYALGRAHGMERAELDGARAAKAAERGGFDRRLVLRLGDGPPVSAVRPFRHSARALLLDGDRLILFRRVKPGRPLYWTTPGGGVEAGDPDPEAALRRELQEELGAEAGPLRQVFAYAEHNPVADYLHTFYVCGLRSMDPGRANAPEFDDPAKGRFEIDRIPCTPEAVARLKLLPEPLVDFLRLHIAELPDLADRGRAAVDAFLDGEDADGDQGTAAR